MNNENDDKSTPTSSITTPTLAATPALEKYDETRPGARDVETAQPATASPPPPSTLLSGWRMVSVLSAMMLSLFLVVLDRTIIATAIPVITSQFHQLNESPWLANIYFLALTGTLLTWGQLLSILPARGMFLLAIAIFEVGSVICGAANNMSVLIFGRAVAGLASSGVMVSLLGLMAQISRIDQRPLMFGIFAGVIALGNVVGPVFGGALTTRVSWRWCFYINLPFGAVTVVMILAWLKPTPWPKSDKTLFKQFLGVDWTGTLLYLVASVCVILGLLWGGVERPWNDPLVVVLLVVGSVVFVAFIAWQWHIGDKRAILPLSVMRRPTVIGCCISACLCMTLTQAANYYLPLYYQAAKGRSAMAAGFEILPFVISSIAGTALSTAFNSWTGKPWHWLMWPPFIVSLGSGLLFWELTFVDEPSAIKLGIFQAIMGASSGTFIQVGIVVVQAEYHGDKRMVPVVSTIVNVISQFGSLLGVTIAGTIFINQVNDGVPRYAPNLSPEMTRLVIQTVSAIADVPEADRIGVVQAYTKALGWIFVMGIPIGILSALSTLLVTPHDLKKIKEEDELRAAAAAAGADTPAPTANPTSGPDPQPIRPDSDDLTRVASDERPIEMRPVKNSTDSGIHPTKSPSAPVL